MSLGLNSTLSRNTSGLPVAKVHSFQQEYFSQDKRFFLLSFYPVSYDLHGLKS